MEYVDSIKRGELPSNPDKIVKIWSPPTSRSDAGARSKTHLSERRPRGRYQGPENTLILETTRARRSSSCA